MEQITIKLILRFHCSLPHTKAKHRKNNIGDHYCRALLVSSLSSVEVGRGRLGVAQCFGVIEYPASDFRNVHRRRVKEKKERTIPQQARNPQRAYHQRGRRRGREAQ